ncbi:hypothetical protein GCM10010507_03810 [Streptomyces cinnamoneus]|uniref:SCO6045-like C-terminal domain-containing protein n=1 Tax=Streptomyces cinnamoneus TaxID=53446 RepID=A0A918TC00_STRCJ|nr:hypothetical protein GCM10010507_03810 [Streptomyces cinnamoneus]
MADDTASLPASLPAGRPAPDGTTDEARRCLAQAQLALLATLVADGPPPDGFDRERLEVQRRALLAKRAGIVAKVAPDLGDILGPDFRRLFLDYARGRPMIDGYQRDALDFARNLLHMDAAPEHRQQLADWVAERTGRGAPAEGPFRRLAAALRIGRPARRRADRKASR